MANPFISWTFGGRLLGAMMRMCSLEDMKSNVVNFFPIFFKLNISELQNFKTFIYLKFYNSLENLRSAASR